MKLIMEEELSRTYSWDDAKTDSEKLLYIRKLDKELAKLLAKEEK